MLAQVVLENYGAGFLSAPHAPVKIGFIISEKEITNLRTYILKPVWDAKISENTKNYDATQVINPPII